MIFELIKLRASRDDIWMHINGTAAASSERIRLDQPLLIVSVPSMV